MHQILTGKITGAATISIEFSKQSDGSLFIESEVISKMIGVQTHKFNTMALWPNGDIVLQHAREHNDRTVDRKKFSGVNPDMYQIVSDLYDGLVRRDQKLCLAHTLEEKSIRELDALTDKFAREAVADPRDFSNRSTSAKSR